MAKCTVALQLAESQFLVTKRLRLSPHDRRMQLLDCAGRIVLDNGLSKFTIDALAKEAAVSTPLIYKYFDTRIAILQALLVRETDAFAAKLKERLQQSTNFEEIVRMFVAINFDSVRAGSLLSVLISQPDVRGGLGASELDWVNRTLVERTAAEFGFSVTKARQLVTMGSAASRSAAQQYSRGGGDRSEAVDDTVRFILGALRAFE